MTDERRWRLSNPFGTGLTVDGPEISLSEEVEVMPVAGCPDEDPREALDAARALAQACEILRFNPCACESCTPYKNAAILEALDILRAALGAVASPTGNDPKGSDD